MDSENLRQARFTTVPPTSTSAEVELRQMGLNCSTEIDRNYKRLIITLVFTFIILFVSRSAAEKLNSLTL